MLRKTTPINSLGMWFSVSISVSLPPSLDFRWEVPRRAALISTFYLWLLLVLTTSVGRKYFGLTLTRSVPVLFSLPISLTPSPSHLIEWIVWESSLSLSRYRTDALTQSLGRSLGMPLRRTLVHYAFHLVINRIASDSFLLLVLPVAMTKSSGVWCWSISHIASM